MASSKQLTRVQASRYLGITYRMLRRILAKGLLTEQGGFKCNKRLSLEDLAAFKARFPKGKPSPVKVRRPPLSDNDKQKKLEALRELAKTRGGECLSTEYFDVETPMQWRCAEGHTWLSAVNNVKKQGTWCRQCHLKYRPKPTGRYKKRQLVKRSWVKKY